MSTSTLEAQLAQIETCNGTVPTVAFFDLDRTLIAGYSIVALARERIRHGLNQGEVKQSTRILTDVLRQQSNPRKSKSSSSYHRLVNRLSKSLKGISEETLTSLGEKAYQNSLASSLYREAIALIEAHRRAGHHLVIVSAASRYQVQPIARALGIEDICCTNLEVVEGVFTGRTIAPLCYGEGKAMAARRVCKQRKSSLQDCWFYSDSSDDLPLLRIVGNPVAVNPSEKLGAHARAKNWPQLHFDSRGMPDIETMARTLLTAQTLAAASAIGAVGKFLKIGKITNANRLTQLVGEVGSAFSGIDLEVEGAEHLGKDRPAVFIFNHQSLLDSMVLAHLLKEDIVALCKKEIGESPLIGPLLRQVDTIFVDREEQNQSAVLKQALDVIKSGRSLVIAPEGTRSALGEIQPFKHGAFYLAKKAGVPVIPLVLHNVKDALPKGGMLIRSTTIRITVLPPMYPNEMGGVRQACEKMEQEYSRVMGNSSIAALPYESSMRLRSRASAASSSPRNG